MENHVGKRRRSLVTMREQQCARHIVASIVPRRIMLSTFQTHFGPEDGAPSRTIAAFVIRCLRRELRSRLVSDQIFPDRSRQHWCLHDDGTWAVVCRRQSTLFKEAAALARDAVRKHVAGGFVRACVNEAMRNHIYRRRLVR